MFKAHTPLSAKGAIVALSALMFFFSAQVSLTIYIDSSYVKEAIEQTPRFALMQVWDNPEHMVGTLYTFASLITLLALISAPKILRRFGNYRWTLSALILHILILLGLASFDGAGFVVPLFIIETALVSVLYFNLDVFLERYSTDAETGEIRGFFLVIGSIAWMLPPFFAGMIIDNFGFQLVYLVGATLMIPTLFIMMYFFRDFQDLRYDDVPLLISRVDAAKHPDIGRILWTNFSLHFFYAWMIIYTPLYFHDQLGISYEQFGLILTLALSAFIIFPYPAGWLADKVLGEKELLVGGFLLMAAATALIPYFSHAGIGVLAWAALLFIGRTGAATVETMAEAYFFKQIDGRSAGLMGYFRRSRPMAFMIAPLSASLLLEFGIVTTEGLFYVLSCLMFLAVYFPLRLKDTL